MSQGAAPESSVLARLIPVQVASAVQQCLGDAAAQEVPARNDGDGRRKSKEERNGRGQAGSGELTEVAVSRATAIKRDDPSLPAAPSRTRDF